MGCNCIDTRSAETEEGFAARVKEFTDSVCKEYEDKAVLVVAGSRWIISWLQQFDSMGELPGYGRVEKVECAGLNIKC